MKTALHVRVYGRVQGVGFRYHTQLEANKLAIAGWVKNCPDGSVEAVIYGQPAAVTAMQQWLQHGPTSAQVTHVEFSAGHLPDGCNDFRIV